MKRTRQSKPTAKRKIKHTGDRKRARAVVHADMNVLDIIALHEKAADILAAYGLHCFQCAFNTMDSLASGARSHGLTEVDIENMVTDIQELLDSAPAKPDTITLTKAAAKALQSIGRQEKKKSVCLRVTAETHGGFCMEFTKKPMSTDRRFVCNGVKNVSLIASPETLWRIGGSTVDFREGKFKLDIEETCGCAGGNCACAQVVRSK